MCKGVQRYRGDPETLETAQRGTEKPFKLTGSLFSTSVLYLVLRKVLFAPPRFKDKCNSIMHKIQIRFHKTIYDETDRADKQGSLCWSDWSVGLFLSMVWASVIDGAGWGVEDVQGEVATRRKTEGRSAWLLLRTI